MIYEHPFFDPKSLTDDELLDKLRKIDEYYQMQHNLGHESAVHSAEMIRDALMNERERRLQVAKSQEDKKMSPPNKSNGSIEIGKIYPKDEDRNER